MPKIKNLKKDSQYVLVSLNICADSEELWLFPVFNELILENMISRTLLVQSKTQKEETISSGYLRGEMTPGGLVNILSEQPLILKGSVIKFTFRSHENAGNITFDVET